MATNVRFWVDPACPWCWTTSQWIRRIADEKDLHITWEPISLMVKNDTQPDSPWYSAVKWTYDLLRVMESVRAAGLEDRLGDLYKEYGRRIHHEGQREWDPALALEAVGLDVSHAAAADDPQWDEPLRARMSEGLALVGTDVGTPIIAITRADGKEMATFGPVITKAPSHDDALKLWDAFLTLTTLDEFWELKRTRTVGPDFGDAP
jgi:predicted DsbA family dithiol-disulfide isomerase